MNNIRYAKRKQLEIVGYSPDNGQGITEMPEVCQLFDCQKWEGETPVAPVLVVNADGFKVCPRCKASYG